MTWLGRDRVIALWAAALMPLQAGAQAVTVRLWQDPGAIASRDLRWGSGAPDRAPRPPFRFVEKNGGGSQPKVVVTDAAGVTWDVKFGEEAHAEVAAVRLVWALGYFVDEVYFVPGGTIVGVANSGRANDMVASDGTFAAARFERRDERLRPFGDGWTFHSNPFPGKRELSGLKILMTLVNNWDIEGERNNRIVEVTRPGASPERRYLVSDLGASFGKMGGRFSDHTKWDLAGYQEEGFIERVTDDAVEFDYDGLETGMGTIPLDHATWFSSLVSQLTEVQVRQAFEAAGATPEQVAGFSAQFLAKVAALRRAVRSGPQTQSRSARP
jgi:hypothetical protein